MKRTPHIGLVCPYSIAVPGGVQNHVLGLAGWLYGEGYQVSILAPDDAPEELWHRHGLPGSVFTSAGRSVAVPYNGSVARINFGPGTAIRVRQWLDRRRPDVLHLHEPITPSAAVLALWTAQTAPHRHRPVVATFHTATPRSRIMQLARPVLERSIERIAARIAVSPTAAEVVDRHLKRDARIIPNGIEVAQLQQPGGDRVPQRLVFLGRLDEPRKGLSVLLAAWPRIRAAHPGSELLLAGAGRRRELPEGCRSLGLVSDAERSRLLASADLFIAPHLGRESFGLVVAEAMAAQAEVVAADIPAFVDVLTGATGQRYGHLFTAGDSAALATTVIGLLDRDGRSAAELRRRAADRAAQYDWSRVGSRISEVYDEVIGLGRRIPAGLYAEQRG